MTNDEWYYDICVSVSKNSKCLSRKVGAILVIDKSVVAQGYNGPPRGVPHCWQRFSIDPKLRQLFADREVIPTDDQLNTICPRYIAGFKSGEGLEWCVAGHAERNALINAAREGVRTKGAKMYMNCGIPCTPCLVEIINAGIEEIIVTKESYYDVSAKYLLDNSHLKWRIFSHLKGE
jgi:dCMP deaminase